MKDYDYSGTATVSAPVVNAFLQSFGMYKNRGIKTICKIFSIEEFQPTPGVWYPLSRFMQSMKEFEKQFGEEFIKKVGHEIGSCAMFPDSIKTLSEFYTRTCESYFMNHQFNKGDIGNEIGRYIWTQTSDRSGVMEATNPYGCAFDNGLLIGFSELFKVNATVTHDDGKPCRHKNGASCSYKVEW